MLARIRKSIKEKDAGFTLVELLVVMIIIGILAAIAIPVFLNQRKKAVDTGIKSDLRSYAQDVETSFVDTQAYSVQPTYSSGAAVLTAAGISQRVSPGNTIEYKGTATGFCLRGYNTNGTTATTGTKTYFIYDSSLGGLQTGKAAAAAPAASKNAC